MAKRKTATRKKTTPKRLTKAAAIKKLDAAQSVTELIPVAEEIKKAGGLKLESVIANKLTMFVHYGRS